MICSAHRRTAARLWGGGVFFAAGLALGVSRDDLGQGRLLPRAPSALPPELLEVLRPCAAVLQIEASLIAIPKIPESHWKVRF